MQKAITTGFIEIGRNRVSDRKKAIAFYEEGMFCCEGAEADRYKEVVRQLKAGRKVASDGVS